MASFKSIRGRVWPLLAALSVFWCFVSSAEAQQQASGFAVERFYQSAPGGGWFVMDDLDISGRLGGAISATSGYERNPLVITGPDGKQKLAVVSQEAFLDIGGSVTHDRFRAYLNIPMPLLVTGTSGKLGPYQYTAPNLTLGSSPDTVSDGRIGVDARLFGQPGDLLRLGAGAQLIFPSGNRSDYVSDARYGGMLRFLAAGDAGAFRYAGQLGVHLRPLNDAPVPGSPNGNEFLYGISGGRTFAGPSGWAVIAGPEIFGETAFHSFFSGETGTEALMTGRLEQTGTEHNLRIKLGVGHALQQNFGAAQWRIVYGVELFGHK
ncbi:hypothetical protein [Granulicella sp. S156]|uniref:hypothetical protein n=1 Tax=Granulicella sp. S156 TaxID=1747224 RepID=UPI00131A6A08|nr:hypothetical protein [Granulicella sp. S156]